MQWASKKKEIFRYKYVGQKCANESCTFNARVQGMCVNCYNRKRKKENESNQSKPN